MNRSPSFAPHVGAAPLRAAVLASALLAAAAQAQPGGERHTGGSWTVGLGVAHAPRYEGADDSRTRALPTFSYRSGRFFAGALSGIGYDASNVEGLSFGPVLSYRFGRDESDSPRLRGLGDVDDGLDLGAFVRWDLKPFFVHARLRHGITGDDKGAQLKLGAGVAVALTPSDRLVFDATLDWADADVMQANFGVSSAQSAASGLPGHQAGAGIRQVGAGLLWTHSVTPQWFTSVGAGVYRLGSEAADSPITQDRSGGLFSVGVGYRF